MDEVEGDRRQHQAGRRSSSRRRSAPSRAARTSATSCRTWPTRPTRSTRPIRENREVIHETLAERRRHHAATRARRSRRSSRTCASSPRTCASSWRATRPQTAAASGELRETIERIDRASKSLESALEHVDSIAGRIDRGEGTIGRLTKDETLINEVQGVAEGVNDYVAGHRAPADDRRPAQRLQLPREHHQELRRASPPAARGQVLRHRAHQRPARQHELHADTTSTRRTRTQPAHYRTITTTTTDAFRFSLQFAQAARAVHRPLRHQGVDGRHRPRHPPPQRPLRDRATTSSASARRSSRATASYIGYEFIKRLWLLGGVDHIFLPRPARLLPRPAAPVHRRGPEDDPAVLGRRRAAARRPSRTGRSAPRVELQARPASEQDLEARSDVARGRRRACAHRRRGRRAAASARATTLEQARDERRPRDGRRRGSRRRRRATGADRCVERRAATLRAARRPAARPRRRRG